MNCLHTPTLGVSRDSCDPLAFSLNIKSRRFIKRLSTAARVDARHSNHLMCYQRSTTDAGLY